MLNDDQIPYELPTLRNAYQLGWEAWKEGKLRPDPGQLKSGKEAKAWLEGYIASDDTENTSCAELELDSSQPEPDDAGAVIGDPASGEIDEDADDNPDSDADDQSGDVPEADLDGDNPYSEDNSRLQRAWREGYRAGKQGNPLPKSTNDVYDDKETELACVEGYQAALEQDKED